jgi:hypothetical protein
MEPKEKYFPEFKEIVERIPDGFSTILVWGLLIFIIILVFLSIVIKVPDRVIAEIRVTSTQPPITLRSQKQGKIKLLKKNFPCKCRSGEYIAVLENPANTDHIQLLKNTFSNRDVFTDSQILSVLNDSVLYLGEVEPVYFNYCQQRQNYEDLINDSKYKYEIELYDEKIKNDSIHLLYLNDILDNNLQQYLIRKKQYQTDSILLEKKAILEAEYNQSYLNMLNLERQMLSLKTDIFSKSQLIIDSKLRKQSLIREYNQSLEIAALSLKESYHSVITQIKAWENAYVFMSVEDGTVDFVNPISDASFILAGEPIFDIVFDDNQFLGIAIMPSLGAGGVKRGQRVNLKMDLYPYQEYGTLEGRVRNISLSSVDKGYLIYVDLPNGLISSSNYEFSFAETIYGQAEIITDNKRLISLIFNQIYKMFNPSRSIPTILPQEQKVNEGTKRTIQL